LGESSVLIIIRKVVPAGSSLKYGAPPVPSSRIAPGRPRNVTPHGPSKWKVKREKRALTPYERVLAREDVSGEAKAGLRAEHEKLNPLVLKREVEKRLAALYDLRKRLREPDSG